MTDEQIIQNAEEWVKPLISEEDGGYNENDVSLSLMKNAFIAGAHSRDEEISRMQESLDECRRALFQLRNPWISVEERFPDKRKDKNGFTDGISINVLAKTDKGEYVTAWYSYNINTWFLCMGEIAEEPVLPYNVVAWTYLPE